MEAEVQFEYEATQDDELSLKAGDIIQNVKEVDDGWCEGELNGKKGMFPDNFVTLRPASSTTTTSSAPSLQPPPTSEPSSAGSVALRNIETGKKIRRAKVTFSYAADNSDELTLEPGQIVEILEEEEEGWWKGRVGTFEGVFPSNFVEEIKQDISQQPSMEPVDSQTGERNVPPAADQSEGHKPAGVRGPMVMPTFDPTKARAQLKRATVAPPLEKPPEHRKASIPTQSKIPDKVVEQAKVIFDYEADNEDELTIKVGEVVSIVSKDTDQDGWWEVSLKGQKGLIPDNFVELLPPQPTPQPAAPQPVPVLPKQVPTKPPAPKEPAKPPIQLPPVAAKAPAKKPDLKKPPPEDQADFPVPKTTPLDTSAMKDRPRNKNRPPSRSNLLSNHEPEPAAAVEEPSEPSSDSTRNLTPWQAELKAKKKQPKLAPKPPGKPKPVVAKPDPPPVARNRTNTGESKPEVKSAVPAPIPKPEVKSAVAPIPKPAQPKLAQAKPAETKPPPPQDTPAQSGPKPTPTTAPAAATTAAAATTTAAAAAATTPPDNSWKEAFENLKEEFDKFKEHMREEIQILTDDLDKERKHRASISIDIDRLKRAQRSIAH